MKEQWTARWSWSASATREGGGEGEAEGEGKAGPGDGCRAVKREGSSTSGSTSSTGITGGTCHGSISGVSDQSL